MLADKLEKEKALLDEKIQLTKKYKKLEVDIGRWGLEKLSTSEVNSIVNKIHMYNSCGCCEDAVLYVSPYLTEGNYRIYSNPVKYTIGEKIPCTLNYKIYEGWEEKLKEQNINPDIIRQVREYIKEVNENES